MKFFLILTCIMFFVPYQGKGSCNNYDEKKWKIWSEWLPTPVEDVFYRYKRTREWDFFLNERPSKIRWDIEVKNKSEFNSSIKLSTYAPDKTLKSSGFLENDEVNGKQVFLNLKSNEVWSGILQDMSKDNRGPSIQFDDE